MLLFSTSVTVQNNVNYLVFMSRDNESTKNVPKKSNITYHPWDHLLLFQQVHNNLVHHFEIESFYQYHPHHYCYPLTSTLSFVYSFANLNLGHLVVSENQKHTQKHKQQIMGEK